MLIQGSGHIVCNNQVVATGGAPQQNAFGIAVKGAGTRVLNNDERRQQQLTYGPGLDGREKIKLTHYRQAGCSR